MYIYMIDIYVSVCRERGPTHCYYAGKLDANNSIYSNNLKIMLILRIFCSDTCNLFYITTRQHTFTSMRGKGTYIQFLKVIMCTRYMCTGSFVRAGIIYVKVKQPAIEK